MSNQQPKTVRVRIPVVVCACGAAVSADLTQPHDEIGGFMPCDCYDNPGQFAERHYWVTCELVVPPIPQVREVAGEVEASDEG